GGAPGVRAGEHAGDAGECGGRARVEGDDAGLRVRAAQHGHVEEAGQAEIVDEAAAARDEADVFLHRQRPAHPGRAHAVAPGSARMTSGLAPPAAAACATARTMFT